MLTNKHILQVSELTKKVRFILESELNTVWLTGEISNFVAASSGHWYLSLKDNQSQVRCAMFKGNNRYTRIKPANGQQVLVKAKVSLYEPRGDFQLIIEQMEDAGEGLLRQQYEKLKKQLTAEGIFSQADKQPIPKQIKSVGIVTSPTGAAVKDIISVIKRRNPLLNIIIYPALVQGELAPNDICQAIYQANIRNEVDVLIVGRGGGSLEDLWSFNDEMVVRTIYQSTIPTISAVGHEIDTTLSDYAADLRAPTPSAAAELVSASLEDKVANISLLKKRLAKAYQFQLQAYSNQFQHLKSKLLHQDPKQQLQIQQQKADELKFRLNAAFDKAYQVKASQPALLSQKLLALSPLPKLRAAQQQQKYLSSKLLERHAQLIQDKQQAFAHVIEQLNIVSPLATLARGYSITRDDNNQIIRNISQVNVDQNVNIQLTDGKIKAKISEISDS